MKPISRQHYLDKIDVISLTPLVTRADDNGVTHLHLRKFLTEGLG